MFLAGSNKDDLLNKMKGYIKERAWDINQEKERVNKKGG